MMPRRKRSWTGESSSHRTSSMLYVYYHQLLSLIVEDDHVDRNKSREPFGG